jgi:peptide/nickel transport system substrate-binding protein
VKNTAFLLAIAALASAGSPFAQTPPAAAEIRVALKSDIRSSMHGHRTRDTQTDNVLLHVVEGLVAYREDLSIGPMLADSWKVSADGKTYTFKIRPGVKFHNGATLTASDVKWNWERIMNPKSEWQCGYYYDGTGDLQVESVTAPDPSTVVFKLDRPHSIFLDKLANMQCPFDIVHKDSLNADGSWKEPIGTGPYRFAEWKKGDYVLLTPFKEYSARTDPPSGFAGRKIAYHPVRWVIIPDASAQKAAIESGGIDLMPFVIEDGVPASTARVDVQVADGLEWNILLMQSRDPLFKDLRVRKAIAHAIDLRALVKAATSDRAKPNPSIVPNASRYYSPAHQKWVAPDVEEAKRLLKEAGYKGEVVKMQCNKRYPNQYDNAVIIQSMLAKAGMNVELEVIDWPTQLGNYVKGSFRMMTFGYSARLDPGLGYIATTGDKDKHPAMQWDSRDAAKVLAEANQTSDFAKRKALFEELHGMWVKDVPAINLYNQPAIDVVSRRLEGYKVWATTKPRLFNVRVKP